MSSEVEFSPEEPFAFPDVLGVVNGLLEVFVGNYSNELLVVFVGTNSRLLLSIQNAFDGELVSGDESDQDGLEESPVKKKSPAQQLNRVVANFSNPLSLYHD